MVIYNLQHPTTFYIKNGHDGWFNIEKQTENGTFVRFHACSTSILPNFFVNQFLYYLGKNIKNSNLHTNIHVNGSIFFVSHKYGMILFIILKETPTIYKI